MKHDLTKLLLELWERIDGVKHEAAFRRNIIADNVALRTALQRTYVMLGEGNPATGEQIEDHIRLELLLANERLLDMGVKLNE